MKKSFYNTYLQINNDYFLYFNSVTASYIILTKTKHCLFTDKDVNSLKKENPDIYLKLLDNGFIVPYHSDKEEMNVIKFNREKRKYSISEYEVIIMPTLDCNLNCWYCCETKIENTYMSSNIRNKILKHLENKYSLEPYSILKLNFFGGEPLLFSNKIVIPLIKQILKFISNKSISLIIGFTTNGTLISDELIDILQNLQVNFQITIDGGQEKHNKVRFYKKNHTSTYQDIIHNIYKINTLNNVSITIRINYDNNTLFKLENLLTDLNNLNKNRLLIDLVKIFQVDNEKIEEEQLKNVIKEIKENGFTISNFLNPNNYTCYADNYNQVSFNYDGKVNKCNFIDFTKAEEEGKLMENGMIIWNDEKLACRLLARIPKNCNICKLLPSCPGICTQKILQGSTNCFFGNKSKDEIIIENFELIN